MIIAISGQPGSGKTTVAKLLAAEFGLKDYYMGGIRRQMAKKRGMTLEEYNQLGEKEDFTDKEVDDYQKKLGETEDNFVIQGRTSYFCIPQAIKIFLEVNSEEGARRIFGHLKEKAEERNEGRDLDSVEAVLRSNQARMKSDKARYQKWYGCDPFDPKHYDYVLDTTNLTIDQVFNKVADFVRQHK
ncbi:cytidylate kinase family protein [Patescibacteria group bacterium]|nr:cytidylate kinase family protein [Patescibacteria group bacterium]